MNQFIDMVFMSALALTSYASSEIRFNENETIALTLSQSNYNRVMIAGDKIKKASCPEQFLAIEYEKEGGVIFDVLYTKPFTVFFETSNGHHFAANVESEESLGKTIMLKPIQTLAKKEDAVPEEPIEKATDNLALTLIQALTQDAAPEGYVFKRDFGSYKPLNKSLRYKVSKRMTGEAFEGERIEVYNHTSLPVV
ncbi:MAG TPA: hypothetical protein DDY37_04925, partial [Legionella sp.]|nr:hypothetical protein [Legionella sp.]